MPEIVLPEPIAAALRRIKDRRGKIALVAHQDALDIHDTMRDEAIAESQRD